jgi:hypothetical protein
MVITLVEFIFLNSISKFLPSTLEAKIKIEGIE